MSLLKFEVSIAASAKQATTPHTSFLPGLGAPRASWTMGSCTAKRTS